MAKYKVKDPRLREEIRRLTQLANRRIRTTAKQYERAGKRVLPSEVVGNRPNLQHRGGWHTPNTPLSRSIVFDSEKEFRKHLRFLQSFDPKISGRSARPTISEYTRTQRSKTAQAIESSLGMEVPTKLLERINTMSAPELSEFWKRYSDKSRQLGVRYSSTQAMQETLNEIFPDDVQAMLDNTLKRTS